MAALTTLEIVAGIDAAVAILAQKRYETVHGNVAVFLKVANAEKHIGKEVEQLLAPDPEPPLHVCAANEDGLCGDCGVEMTEACPFCLALGLHRADCPIMTTAEPTPEAL
jgi:hypothetical protein